MMNSYKILYITFCILLTTACSHKPSGKIPVEQHFYKLTFDNKTVGRLSREQYITGHGIKNIEILEIKTQFKGMDTVTTRIIEIQEKSEDGKKIRISKTYDTPLAKNKITAEIIKKSWKWQETRGSKHYSGSIDFPDDFFLHHELKNIMKNAIKDRQPISYSEWNAKDKTFDRVMLEIKDFDENRNAWLVKQTYPTFPDRKTSTFWVDSHFNQTELNMSYLGKDLLLIPCNNNCAQEPLEALRPLDYQMLASPYRITEAALKGKIRYQIKMHSTLTPPATQEQKIRKDNNYWVLDVCANCENKTRMNSLENIENYLQENHWMETSDAALVNKVNRSINTNDTADKKMKKLVKAARSRLEPNLQFSGYATASQAFQSRGGDCTEYALLLGAMGRIAKIPTRIVFGLSYSREYFHGKRHMFAPHAWVQAWIDGEWKSYDAGLESFDAGHIALKISDGSQEDFNEIFDYFTELKIISAQQIINKSKNN